MPDPAQITRKGIATRARIVETAADMVLARGAAGTSLDDIRHGTATSKSQLFHYFPGGKAELVGAIAALQSQRVLDAQRPYLDSLATWEEWEAWRDAVIAHYGSQPHWGCPIGALSAETAREDGELAAELAEHMDRWRSLLEDGVRRLIAGGHLPASIDPERSALGVFAALQGGLQLTQTMRSLEPLAAALDGALAGLRAAGSV